MLDKFKDILKTGALWFAAGALFALAGPYIAPVLGIADPSVLGHAINPLWLGSMLAGTGMIATTLEPVISGILGIKKDKGASTCDAKEKSAMQEPALQPEQEASMGADKWRTHIRQEQPMKETSRPAI